MISLSSDATDKHALFMELGAAQSLLEAEKRLAEGELHFALTAEQAELIYGEGARLGSIFMNNHPIDVIEVVHPYGRVD